VPEVGHTFGMQTIDTIAVTTQDAREDLLDANNSAAWSLNYDEWARKLKWLVIVRNIGSGLRQPVLLCPIDAVVCRPDSRDKRKKYSIEFKRFVDLSAENAPAYSTGTQNPVALERLSKFLAVDPQELTFSDVPDKSIPYSYSRRTGEAQQDEGLTIAEAKRRLALHLGVSPETIDITIRA
jgi:hypothetical protein